MIHVKKIYFKFFLLIMTFVIPIIISWFLYTYHDFFQFNTTNHGILIAPPIQAKAFIKNDMRQWNIFYIPRDCSAMQKTIYTLHQLHKALGKNQNRVSLLIDPPASCTIKEAYEFHQLALTSSEYRKIQDALKTEVSDKIYLVDPLGNIFMYYLGNTDPMNILKDIKKVLEVSQIG